MAELWPPGSNPHGSQPSLVAIGIRYFGPSQRHVALVYEDEDGDIRMSHLKFHLQFEDAQYDLTYHWTLIADLEPEERPSIIAALDTVKKLQPEIPFGFRDAGCRFRIDPLTRKAVFETGNPGTGLTCATYITVLFSSLNLPLVLPETWPVREDDIAWQQSIIEYLRRHASEEHVIAVQNTRGASRLRPEEVVAACLQTDRPVAFSLAEEIAREVMAEIAS